MKQRLVLFLAWLLAAPVAAQDAPPRTEFFETRIRPVLVKHCYRCHSAEAGKARGD